MAQKVDVAAEFRTRLACASCDRPDDAVFGRDDPQQPVRLADVALPNDYAFRGISAGARSHVDPRRAAQRWIPVFTGMTRIGAARRLPTMTPIEAFPRLLGLFLRSGPIEPRARLQCVCKCGVVCVFQVGP